MGTFLPGPTEPAGRDAVLIVQDGARSLLPSIECALSSTGVEVLRVFSADAARDLLASERPRVVVLRLGATGAPEDPLLDLLDEIRTHHPSIRTMVVGASADVARRARVFWLGASDWVDDSEPSASFSSRLRRLGAGRHDPPGGEGTHPGLEPPHRQEGRAASRERSLPHGVVRGVRPGSG